MNVPLFVSIWYNSWLDDYHYFADTLLMAFR